jgi:sialate O-acetylesterase
MKTQRIFKTLVLFFFLFSFNMLRAEIKLPAVLANNMVLQQQTNVKLWGDADPQKQVKVKTSWNNKEYSTYSDRAGKWLLEIETPQAGGPYEISISDGKEIKLENILIGEVWFCSGQSNMEMPLKGFDRQPLIGTNEVIAKANPKVPIRAFIVDTDNGRWIRQFSKEEQPDIIGKWVENISEDAAHISAAAYFFAQFIQEVLDVPVGVIVSTWGGSRLEAWMSREAISPFSEVDLSILDNKDEIKNPTATPCVLYNAKIAPFHNFAIKGFLWYQGESNRHNPDLYAQMMPAFVKDLRNRWNVGEFPFYFVQITPYNYEGADGTSAARFREVQTQNMKDIPRSGMVTTLDVGHPTFIHPMDKKTIGNRLAFWALADTYGKKGFGYVPPIYRDMEIKGNRIYINFDNAPEGISPMWTDLGGFEIAGEDKVYHPAKAEIEVGPDRLAVYSENVPNPIAVRYAYKNYVEPSIFSIYGIPVAPFRTDN